MSELLPLKLIKCKSDPEVSLAILSSSTVVHQIQLRKFGSFQLGSWVYNSSRIDLKAGTFEVDTEEDASSMWTIQSKQNIELSVLCSADCSLI